MLGKINVLTNNTLMIYYFMFGNSLVGDLYFFSKKINNLFQQRVKLQCSQYKVPTMSLVEI